MQTTFKKGGAKLLLDLAQLEEHRTVNPGVAGSIPAIENAIYPLLEKVEQNFASFGSYYFAPLFLKVDKLLMVL